MNFPFERNGNWGLRVRDYLAEMRIRFKPKRNFIKLLDEVCRWMG
jgi:hypothetical protein